MLAVLASFAGDLELDRIPAAVQAQASLSLLDTVACIVAGARAPEAQQVLAAERASSVGGTTPVLTTAHRLSPEAAARVHGYWGDVFELNDLTGGHASIGVIPAVLAAATKYRNTGAEVIAATVAGIEVTSRIYASVYPTLKPYTEAGLVIPGLVNAFGAAAAVARLAKLPTHTLGEAMAIAGTLTTWCPAEAIFGDGGTVKPMLFGASPAAAALQAVTYAAHGMTGPARILESKLGLFRTLSTGAVQEFGTGSDEWHLARPRRKLHACCGYLHAAIDAIAELRAKVGRETLLSGRVEVRMPGYVLPAVAKPALPISANDARFHIRYAVALAMTGTDVIRPEHSLYYRDFLTGELLDAFDRIRIVEGTALTHYHQCEVVLHTADGASVTMTMNGPRGTPQNPLSDDEIRAKALNLLRGSVSGGDTEGFVDRVLGVVSEGTIDWIADDLRPTA
ncbi:MAG: MmgE/PrpD family protein [Rhodococcus sp. (in: high G+C Gram-positive bacteria)]|nr:MAG: MmgE/PrpD family protein [Rhodococcus sp. (in: high G+C Gram-positive bacteria)]